MADSFADLVDVVGMGCVLDGGDQLHELGVGDELGGGVVGVELLGEVLGEFAGVGTEEGDFGAGGVEAHSRAGFVADETQRGGHFIFIKVKGIK